jgi:hypothetical protein
MLNLLFARGPEKIQPDARFSIGKEILAPPRVYEARAGL